MRRRLLSNCRRFLGDRRGNIAILFGLAIVPIFGIMGLALDYSWANMQRTEVLAAADNTLLALSKLMPLTDEELQEKGRTFFQANLGKTTLNFDVSDTADFSIVNEASGKLALDVHATYPLTVGSVLNKFFNTPTTMPISTHSEVQWGNTRLRVALVLDVSISMNDDGKLAALKTATNKLLDILKDVATNPADVYVAIVPFSTNVNIGSSYTDSGYIDWSAWDANQGKTNGTCSTKNTNGHTITSQSSCQSVGTCSVSGTVTSQSSCGTCSISGNNSQSSCESAHACSKNPSQNNTHSKCTSAGGTWSAGVWTSANWTQSTWSPDHTAWNGCVTDRGLSSSSPDTPQGLDQKLDGVDSSDDRTKWQADSRTNVNCPTPITPLTNINNWSNLTSAVTALDVANSTNQPIGLVWGWQILKGTQGPFAPVPAKDSQYAYSDTIILMSDGLNTQNRWYSMKTPSNANVDKRMYDSSSNPVTGTCNYVKADNVQIYTVQVNTGGDPTSTLLQNCATTTSMFFELKTADALITTFQQIGSALANIHISQ